MLSLYKNFVVVAFLVGSSTFAQSAKTVCPSPRQELAIVLSAFQEWDNGQNTITANTDLYTWSNGVLACLFDNDIVLPASREAGYFIGAAMNPMNCGAGGSYVTPAELAGRFHRTEPGNF